MGCFDICMHYEMITTMKLKKMPSNSLYVIYLQRLWSLNEAQSKKREGESPSGSSTVFSLGTGRSPKSGIQIESVKPQPFIVNVSSTEVKPEVLCRVAAVL